MTGHQVAHHGTKSINPILMMVAVILASAFLTYVIEAGRFSRHDGIVIAGTYKAIPKIGGLTALLAPGIATPAPNAPVAYAASIFRMLASIPDGLAKNVQLEYLVLLAGGMFGILRKAGTIDAGVDRLIHATGGNKYILIPLLMIVLGLGSTFMGFVTEYIIVIPIVAIVGERLGYGKIFSLAVVGVAAKVGYMTSVMNPFALVVAQPLAHVPLFSGMGFRFSLFILFMAVGVAYVLYAVRPIRPAVTATEDQSARLSARNTSVLLTLLLAGITMVVGSIRWSWGVAEVSALYVGFSFLVALGSGLPPRVCAEAFVDGMKSLFLGALLIGFAGAVQIVLQNSFVLDTLVARGSAILEGESKVLCANGLMAIEMALGVLVPSTSGKVTMSMPILAPIAHLAGVSGQTTVLAFILGNGLTNTISPTTGVLLAYIAAAKVSFGDWFCFILPLFATFLVLSSVALAVAVITGY